MEREKGRAIEAYVRTKPNQFYVAFLLRGFILALWEFVETVKDWTITRKASRWVPRPNAWEPQVRKTLVKWA
jgi:hypothetical protein